MTTVYNHRETARRALLFFVVTLAVTRAAAAQDTASLSGAVTDSSGGTLAGAAVALREQSTGITRKTITGPAGRYSLPVLAPGDYELRVAAPHFKAAVERGIALAAGQNSRVDVTLELGPMNAEVVVNGAPPPLDTAMGQTFGLVNRRQIRDLPLNGRSFDQLLTLNPGIVNYTAQKLGGVGVSNSAVANMFAVSGRRPQENLFVVDGIEYSGSAEINMQPGGTSGVLLGVDAIREFNVLTDTYGAQYGKRSGAQVLIVTQSGTNQVHGAAFEFLRNNAFDARNFFDHGPAPAFARNQFGASLGGPLRRNRTFLFGNFEELRQRLGLSDVTLIPDANARAGYLPGPGGALVPVGVAPGAAALLSLWPLPNGPELGGGIAEAFSHPRQDIRDDFGMARLDHVLAAADTLAAGYTVDDSAGHTPTPNPLSSDVESLREQVVTANETHVLSPRAVNSVGLGFTRASYFYTGKPAVDLPGFLAGEPIGAVVIGGNATPNTPSQITLAGSNYGSHLFATRNLFTAQDSLSFTHGAHQWSAGLWLQRIQSNDELALGQYGQAVFSNLAAFLAGQVSTFTAVPSPTPLGWRSLEGAFYLIGEWRLTPRLTVTLGLRDEFTNGWNEVAGRGANFVFGSGGVLATQPRVAASVFTTNHAKFLPQPRVGIAWSPGGAAAHTVVRAGFGLYNDLQDALSYRLDQNAPFNTTVKLTNIPLSDLPLARAALPASGLIAPAGVQPELRTPAVIAYTLQIERELPRDAVLSVEYAGSHGYHEILSADVNQPFPTLCPAAPCPATLAPGTSYLPPGAPLANPNLAGSWTWMSEGVSSYNALKASLRRRMQQGLELRASYAWAKSIDDGDTLNGSAAANAPGLVEDARNLRLDRGLSTFDVRQAASISATCELPFGPGKHWLPAAAQWAEKLAGGWTLNGIATLQTGFPFTPELSFNPSNNGNSLNPVRPSLNPAFQGRIVNGGPDQYFNPQAFVVPVNGTYGNLGRDALTGPGLSTLDLAASKNMLIGERLTLQFRAEVFNVLNHSNFNTPNLIVFTSPAAPPSSTAGVVTSASTSSRQVQLALKMIW